MEIYIIAAQSRNRVIGQGGKVPWELPADYRYFKYTTMGYPVIMGRHTYESLGKPLPNRRNIVITKTVPQIPGCDTAQSLDEAIQLAKKDSTTVFVIGGGKTYEEALPHATRLYVTNVQADIEGDTYFPEIEPDDWREVQRVHRNADAANEYAMDWIVYERQSPDKKGFFVVFEGTDGSGKATQSELLKESLLERGYSVRMLAFPQYENNVFGQLIGECLSGKHGDFASLDPKVTSALYAADRFESRLKIEEWLEGGKVVIGDRYVHSNQIHQASKIEDPKEREEFLMWLERVEYGIFGLPRPDTIVYLDVPVAITKELLKKAGETSVFLDSGLNPQDQSSDPLEKARESALDLVKHRNMWSHIPCARDGKLLPKEAVHSLVWEAIKSKVTGATLKRKTDFDTKN